MLSELVMELKHAIPEERIGEGTIDSYGNGGRLVVYPTSEEEVASVLKYANEHGKKVIIEGAGSKKGFGGVIEEADLVLSMSHYTGVVEHATGDLTMTVKAGTTFKELQTYLAKHGQKIALDPALPEKATIGGIIAANESGPKRLGYGSARDNVIGLRIVYPDGTIIRSGGKVVKNVAGYDMNKLFIGSMGTLGVMTEVTLKLRPIAACESLVLITFPEDVLGDRLRAFATEVLDSVLEPTSLQLINPELSEKLAGVGKYTVAMSFEDVESSVRYQEDMVAKMLPEGSGISIYREDETRRFWNAIYAMGAEGATDSEQNALLKVGVVNLDVLHVFEQGEALMGSRQVKIQAHGGLGHGLCTVHIAGAGEDVLSAIRELRTSVEKVGGYVVVKSLPFRERQKINVWGEPPSYFFLLQGIKSKVDPNSVLNHKRFVGGI
ncbi:FAD-binding oxidoreductase [Rossellomorea aquimaris]|uniref:FAD-binding oxidoreductase n=1 Tax=Rossellomorea aquimaris TaxID=189382 RepID=UPI001CD6B0A6|nr:FAD-binding oxidoreductase [Rossellomorea aquimaris]MCA1055767.1 FAD-binding oxidoreductase [Rossellomorea aquimaris]